MSARNTGLFVPGHLDAQVFHDLFRKLPELPPAFLEGEEAPRLHHGERRVDGRVYPFSHIALRLFEVAGLRLLDEDSLPGDEDIEVALGIGLSSLQGEAIYLRYDEEQGMGGAVRFLDGTLVARTCIDGRPTQPVRRELGRTVDLVGLDPSDWIWELAGDAVEAAATPIVGPGIRDDNTLEALIALGSPAPQATGGPTAGPANPAAPPRRREKLKAWLRGILRDDQPK
jgi:hypothetical protein